MVRIVVPIIIVFIIIIIPIIIVVIINIHILILIHINTIIIININTNININIIFIIIIVIFIISAPPLSISVMTVVAVVATAAVVVVVTVMVVVVVVHHFNPPYEWRNYNLYNDYPQQYYLCTSSWCKKDPFKLSTVSFLLQNPLMSQTILTENLTTILKCFMTLEHVIFWELGKPMNSTGWNLLQTE